MMTTAELARVAGISRRMIQWWVEHGIIKPRRRRRFVQRFFDDDQVFKTFIVRDLRRRNVTLAKIRRLKLLPTKGDYLLIIRNRVEWAGRESLIEHIRRVHSPVMLVSIYDLRMEYAAAMERRVGVTSAVPPLRHLNAA